MVLAWEAICFKLRPTRFLIPQGTLCLVGTRWMLTPKCRWGSIQLLWRLKAWGACYEEEEGYGQIKRMKKMARRINYGKERGQCPLCDVMWLHGNVRSERCLSLCVCVYVCMCRSIRWILFKASGSEFFVRAYRTPLCPPRSALPEAHSAVLHFGLLEWW